MHSLLTLNFASTIFFEFLGPLRWRLKKWIRKIIHKLDQYSGMVDVMPEFIVMHSTPVRVELRLQREMRNRGTLRSG